MSGAGERLPPTSGGRRRPQGAAHPSPDRGHPTGLDVTLIGAVPTPRGHRRGQHYRLLNRWPAHASPARRGSSAKHSHGGVLPASAVRSRQRPNSVVRWSQESAMAELAG